MFQQPAKHQALSCSGSVPSVGTPPAQGPCPVPPRQRNRSSSSNVVTFTRHSRVGSEGSNVGSYKAAHGSPIDIQQRRNSFADRPPRSFGRSASNSESLSTTTGFELPRPPLVPQHRQGGFEAATDSSERPAERLDDQREMLAGALSRELSRDRLQQTTAASQSLKVRCHLFSGCEVACVEHTKPQVPQFGILSN